ncbi:MAG: zinc transporter ZitB [Syntrophorhabdus sp. PtaU1.Bin058]|nr:MAG: zinc transporter ZitB [Syntrophorhabdus sp. PtaU1.Bin058]
MFKTTFRISKMDCPSEEQMVRVRLEGVDDIRNLKFDIPGRRLEVYHAGGYERILTALEDLRLDTELIFTEEIEPVGTEEDSRQQRRILWQVLAINLFFFVLEMLAGFIAGSMGLVADSLDMLADSIVYGLSLFAVGGTAVRKKKIAGAAGYFQLALAVLGFAEVIRRFLGYGETPDFYTMIVISTLALAGNATCLYLLQRSKSREVHMQASMIFTSMDVIVNFGVIVAGICVYLTGSKMPDLIVGTIVFILVGRGAFRILRLSR